MSIKTKIRGYVVEIEECDDSTGCWVATRDDRFTGSLQCLQDTGELTNGDTGLGHIVHPDVIEEITEWAEKNGW